MGGKSSSVKMDPMASQAAWQQAETGREMAQLGRDEFEFQRDIWNKYDPYYQQIINQQLSEAQKNEARADDQWNQYKNVFQPIENQMAEEAMNYDSADEVARREGLAAATVAKQFDASDAQMSRDMARMGVSPTSSLGSQSQINQANSRALAKAGAVNEERNNTKLLGMSLRQQAAQFGRNMPSTGLAASAAALQGGNSATGNMGNSMQTAGMAGQNAGSLMGAGASQLGSAANTYANMWGQQQSAKANSNAGLGSLLGTGLSFGMMAFSSKGVKENKEPVSDEAALQGLENVPVESWKYKEGVADGGQHVGPYAEDMQAEFGDDVAPGGKAIDMISAQGKHHAAIRALGQHDKKLNQRLKRLEQAVGLSDTLPENLKGDLGAQAIGLE